MNRLDFLDCQSYSVDTDTPKMAATSPTRRMRSAGSFAFFEFMLNPQLIAIEERYGRSGEDSPEAPEAKVGRNFIAYLLASYPAKAESL